MQGIRANAILPGLVATSMAIDVRAQTINKPRDEIMRARDARVPLRGQQGTDWDVANAALSLASDEADFIIGVSLPTDGAMRNQGIRSHGHTKNRRLSLRCDPLREQG